MGGAAAAGSRARTCSNELFAHLAAADVLPAAGFVTHLAAAGIFVLFTTGGVIVHTAADVVSSFAAPGSTSRAATGDHSTGDEFANSGAAARGSGVVALHAGQRWAASGASVP